MCGDLTFEEGGNPVSMNRIIVGFDPVLVDTYAAELIGLDPNSIEYINLAEQFGVGSANLKKKLRLSSSVSTNGHRWKH